MSKNVSNIFKITLIEILQQRLNKLKDDTISSYVEQLLSMPQLEYFKVVESSKKVKVVQIDRQKFKTARAIIEASF
jgi:hypothetical protein